MRSSESSWSRRAKQMDAVGIPGREADWTRRTETHIAIRALESGLAPRCQLQRAQHIDKPAGSQRPQPVQQLPSVGRSAHPSLPVTSSLVAQSSACPPLSPCQPHRLPLSHLQLVVARPPVLRLRFHLYPRLSDVLFPVIIVTPTGLSDTPDPVRPA